jgi:uncharacterized protein YjbI with pentapeptide repeats
MRLTTLFHLATLVATSASAASYQKRDGTIVDPILNRFDGNPQPFIDTNLEPYADLTGANLTDAKLTGAKLVDADLTGAYLVDAVLIGASFSYGTILFDGQTVLQHGFDAAGLEVYLEAAPLNALEADNLTIVPEPAALLLALLALVAAPLRVRRG